jgi:1,4-dihydroxy-2-naphthoate octaprenyltransferase
VLLGLAGLGLGLLYSLPGVQLSARGIGEAAVAVSFGVLPVLGAVWLQAGRVDSGALLICLPVSAWAAAILIVNEVPDIEADRRAHKRTLAVRWGASGARWIYSGLTLFALAVSGAAIALRALPPWYAAIALAIAGLSLRAASGISTTPAARPQLKRSIQLSLAIHALGCICLLATILIQRFAGA